MVEKIKISVMKFCKLSYANKGFETWMHEWSQDDKIVLLSAFHSHLSSDTSIFHAENYGCTVQDQNSSG